MSHCTNGCKEDVKRTKKLGVVFIYKTKMSLWYSSLSLRSSGVKGAGGRLAGRLPRRLGGRLGRQAGSKSLQADMQARTRGIQQQVFPLNGDLLGSCFPLYLGGVAQCIPPVCAINAKASGKILTAVLVNIAKCILFTSFKEYE
uniref:Uncharacterized protein n=1 Tax=Laticauda laticaudata TaxID=8630 RepID=A0A8C5SQI1_LATLA